MSHTLLGLFKRTIFERYAVKYLQMKKTFLGLFLEDQRRRGQDGPHTAGGCSRAMGVGLIIPFCLLMCVLLHNTFKKKKKKKGRLG